METLGYYYRPPVDSWGFYKGYQASSSGTRLQFLRKHGKEASWKVLWILARYSPPRNRQAKTVGCLKPSLAHSFIHSFNQWLRAYYVSGTVLCFEKEAHLLSLPSITLLSTLCNFSVNTIDKLFANSLGKVDTTVWMCVSPPKKFICWNQNPKVMVLGGEAFD